MHFGFALAYNKTDFRIHTIKNSTFPDTVIGEVTYGMKTIYTKADPGFALGIISDFRVMEYLRLHLAGERRELRRATTPAPRRTLRGARPPPSAKTARKATTSVP